jgi:hypothetical protein
MLPAKPRIFKRPPAKPAPQTPGLTGNFNSQIPTAAPLMGSHTQQYSQYKPVFQPNGGGFGAADQSRGAFARALSDSQNAASAQDVQDFNLGLQRKSQQARAQDVQQQRQVGTDRFGMTRQADTARKDIANRRRQGLADIATQLDVSRKNAQAAQIDNAFNFTASALSLFSPTSAVMGGARVLGGGILNGLRG